jgi:hypothetical protein
LPSPSGAGFARISVAVVFRLRFYRSGLQTYSVQLTMTDEANLERARPDVWNGRALFSFIEDCWNNSIAAVGNKNLVALRLVKIDEVFDNFHKVVKPTSVAQLIPAFLFMRSFSAFRASVMVSLSLPTDGFALQRSCLENAGYARLIGDDSARAEAWLRRDEDKASKKLIRDTFTQSAIHNSIAAKDVKLSQIYQELYERCIDFGAHPNEKAVTLGLVRGSLKTQNIQFRLLPGDGLELDHSLRTAAQVGICVLKVFRTIFNIQFDSEGLSEQLEQAAQGF